MIDNLTLLLSHGLILIAFWRLLSRPDLDNERPVDPASQFHPRPQAGTASEPGDA